MKDISCGESEETITAHPDAARETVVYVLLSCSR